jgi:hypothetical protein
MDLPQFDRIEVEQKPNGLFLQKLILIDGRQEIHYSALRHFSVSEDTLIRAKEQIEVIINCALPGEKQANPQKNRAAILGRKYQTSIGLFNNQLEFAGQVCSEHSTFR